MFIGQRYAGKQQWGMADNGTSQQNWSKTVTFPIAFANTNYVVGGSAIIESGMYITFVHRDRTTKSMFIRACGCWETHESRYATWFAIGLQLLW